MTVLDLFVAVVMAQVTLLTAAALIVIRLGRRHPALRHAAGVIGLLLVVGSPLLVLALPRPAWLVVEQTSSLEPAAPATDQAAELRGPGVASNPGLTEPPEFAAERLPGRDFVTPPVRIPDSLERTEPVEIPAAVSPGAAAPRVVEPPSTAAQPLEAPGDVVPLQQAEELTTASRRRGLSTFIEILAAVWCCGVVIAAVRDWRRRRELRVIARTAADADLDRAAHAVRLALGLSRLPRIRVSDLCPLPFVLGVWKSCFASVE